jgi:hypothetical protein
MPNLAKIATKHELQPPEGPAEIAAYLANSHI